MVPCTTWLIIKPGAGKTPHRNWKLLPMNFVEDGRGQRAEGDLTFLIMAPQRSVKSKQTHQTVIWISGSRTQTG